MQVGAVPFHVPSAKHFKCEGPLIWYPKVQRNSTIEGNAKEEEEKNISLFELLFLFLKDFPNIWAINWPFSGCIKGEQCRGIQE